jgi:hypothetical protein
MATIPQVPETVPVKYNAAKIAAITSLTTLSVLPMFFFITLLFKGLNKCRLLSFV